MGLGALIILCCGFPARAFTTSGVLQGDEMLGFRCLHARSLVKLPGGGDRSYNV